MCPIIFKKMSNMQKNRNVPFWWITCINFFVLLQTANALNVKGGYNRYLGFKCIKPCVQTSSRNEISDNPTLGLNKRLQKSGLVKYMQLIYAFGLARFRLVIFIHRPHWWPCMFMRFRLYRFTAFAARC